MEMHERENEQKHEIKITCRQHDRFFALSCIYRITLTPCFARYFCENVMSSYEARKIILNSLTGKKRLEKYLDMWEINFPGKHLKKIIRNQLQAVSSFLS